MSFSATCRGLALPRSQRPRERHAHQCDRARGAAPGNTSGVVEGPLRVLVSPDRTVRAEPRSQGEGSRRSDDPGSWHRDAATRRRSGLVRNKQSRSQRGQGRSLNPSLALAPFSPGRHGGHERSRAESRAVETLFVDASPKRARERCARSASNSFTSRTPSETTMTLMIKTRKQISRRALFAGAGAVSFGFATARSPWLSPMPARLPGKVASPDLTRVVDAESWLSETRPSGGDLCRPHRRDVQFARRDLRRPERQSAAE